MNDAQLTFIWLAIICLLIINIIALVKASRPKYVHLIKSDEEKIGGHTVIYEEIPESEKVKPNSGVTVTQGTSQIKSKSLQ